jgi:hypothetical protein
VSLLSVFVGLPFSSSFTGQVRWQSRRGSEGVGRPSPSRSLYPPALSSIFVSVLYIFYYNTYFSLALSNSKLPKKIYCFFCSSLCMNDFVYILLLFYYYYFIFDYMSCHLLHTNCVLTQRYHATGLRHRSNTPRPVTCFKQGTAGLSLSRGRRQHQRDKGPSLSLSIESLMSTRSIGNRQSVSRSGTGKYHMPGSRR